MLAVLISWFNMVTRWMNFRVIFLIKRKVLNWSHDIALSHVNHGFDVVYEALMLNLCSILDTLLDFNWILIDLCTKICCNFDLNVCLGDVILENQEHGLVALKQYFVLMRVEIFRWYRVLAHVCSVDDAEAVLDQNSLVQGLHRIDVWWLCCRLLGLLLITSNARIIDYTLQRLRPDILLNL